MVNVKVVIGANYGDEGKGLVSGCLAREASAKGEKILTVFYNGTTQRAHTFNGQIRRDTAAGVEFGSDTFYYRQFVVDPIALYITKATPIIDGECRVILPCDVITNRKLERERGTARHGSCGFGLFEAVKRSKHSQYNIKVKDFEDPWSLFYKLKEIEQIMGSFDDELYNLHNFMRSIEWVKNSCKIESFEETIKNYDTVIFEGGQGLLLDQQNRADFPHLTPSSPGSTYISKDINSLGIKPQIYYVSRSYMTRHGAGPMECECSKESINYNIVDETNQPNDWQGELRFGKLNMNSFWDRIRKDAGLYHDCDINTVFTQLNYTDGALETNQGQIQLEKPSFVHSLFVSDQKDYMNLYEKGI